MQGGRTKTNGIMAPGMANAGMPEPPILPGSPLEAQLLPGLPPEAQPPAMQQAHQTKMTVDRLRKANEILGRYKASKSAQDQRVIENEKWYRQRHWEYIEANDGDQSVKYQTKSAWLFNALNILHSDAMDAFPRLNVLPREEGDREEAARLSSILPVVLEQNDFREVYDENTWRKGRSGTGVYGIFWDKSKLNGLGDIAIEAVDTLNLFWEHGKRDIQKSANVFHVEMTERDRVLAEYPNVTKRALGGTGFEPREYQTEDRSSRDDRVAVIDWYYKLRVNGKTVLHYCKYVNTTVLYASEDDWNDPDGKGAIAERGWYDHGLYPFEIDPFYPLEGSPAGFGLIDVNKSAQEQIDLLNSAIVTNALMNAIPRYFRRNDGGINDEDLLDWTKPIIGYDGNSIEGDLMPVQAPRMDGSAINVLQAKIEELKTTSGSSDVATGHSSAGVTAYSAIAALIETAGKNTKAFSAGSYRAMRRIGIQVIELIRQFYDIPRQFRILGQQGEERFIEYSNAGLQQQPMGMAYNGEGMYRLPMFDLQVSAEKETTYTRLAQNELAKELMGMGVFNPQLVDQSVMMLDMMDFDGKDALVQKIRGMGDMAQKLAYFQQIALELAQKYDPALAEQIAGAIMQGAPRAPTRAAAPAGDGFGAEGKVETDPISGVSRREHANGGKARGMVDEATRPS